MLLGFFVVQRLGIDREEQFFSRFNSTDMNGKIVYSEVGYHGCVFKIENIEEEFVFYPISGDLNNRKIFCYVAEKGDLIIKQAYSDTLRLIKKDKAFMYKFHKPSDR